MLLFNPELKIDRPTVGHNVGVVKITTKVKVTKKIVVIMNNERYNYIQITNKLM